MHNSDPIRTRVGRVCCVPNCRPPKNKTAIQLFPFPKDEKLKNAWKSAVRIGMEIGLRTYICSEHFVESDFKPLSEIGLRKRLRKNAVPTGNLTLVNSQVEKLKEKQNTSETETASSEYSDGEFYESFCEVQEIGLQNLSGTFSLFQALETDAKLYSFTGIHHELLNRLVELVEDTADCNEMICNNVRLTLIIVFTKLRTNLSHVCLSVLFGNDSVTIKEAFSKLISLLYLSLEPFVYWPTKHESRSNTKEFGKFRNVRVILDTIELDNLEFLVGVTPFGTISYISESYSNSILESMFERDKLLDKLSPNDVIVVNKIVCIDEYFKEKSVAVVQPDFCFGREFSEGDFERAVAISDETLRKIKKFSIFKEAFNDDYAINARKFLVIVAAVINMSSPVLGRFA